MGWLPEPVELLLNTALVAELTVVRADGRAVTHPLIPLYDGSQILMHSSTLFSKKLEHIKANPHVAVSLSDPVGNKGLLDRATIQGDARVIEDDPHRQWEKLILELWRAKEPSIDDFLKARVALPLFFERAVIAITPRRCLFWSGGDTSVAPVVTDAPAEAAA
jgi:general stress protein 26